MRRPHRGLVRVHSAYVCAFATSAVVAALTVSSRATAQPTEPSALALRADLAPADAGAWHLEQCIAGITYGAPLKWAVSYGGGVLRESNGGPDMCALAVAKIGIGGAQGSLGAGTSFAPWGTGVMFTGNVLRTFGSPLKATPRRTYVGASLHLWPALALGGEIGYYVRLGDAVGASSSGKRLVAWSAGFGF